MLVFGETRDFFTASGELGLESIKLLARMMRLEHAQIRMQRLVSPRFACLPLQGADLALYLFDNVTNAQEICLSGFQLAQCLALLRLIFCDSSRFLENCAPIFRTRTQDHVDFALLHHGVSRACDSGVRKKILNIAKAARRFVQEVFGVAVPVHAARDAHVMPFDSKLFTTVGESERDFCESYGLPCIRAVEDHIR